MSFNLINKSLLKGGSVFFLFFLFSYSSWAIRTFSSNSWILFFNSVLILFSSEFSSWLFKFLHHSIISSIFKDKILNLLDKKLQIVDFPEEGGPKTRILIGFKFRYKLNSLRNNSKFSGIPNSQCHLNFLLSKSSMSSPCLRLSSKIELVFIFKSILISS